MTNTARMTREAHGAGHHAPHCALLQPLPEITARTLRDHPGCTCGGAGLVVSACDCETCRKNRDRRMSANVVVLEARRGE